MFHLIAKMSDKFLEQ